jgi:hypothetical protein
VEVRGITCVDVRGLTDDVRDDSAALVAAARTKGET